MLKIFFFPNFKTKSDKYSIMGDFGYSYKGIGLKDFLKDWKIDIKTITSGSVLHFFFIIFIREE